MRGSSPSMTNTLSVTRSLEMLHHLGAQRGLLLGAPLAKSFARLEAEFAVVHKPFEIGRGTGARFDIRQNGSVDRKRQVGTDEIGVFEMTGKGLAEVANPSALFLGDRDSSAPGTAVFAGLEGTRPLLCEIQALVAPAGYGTPRRAVVGWDKIGRAHV